ncbi:50S ribosomal protein L21e [Candidatus Woesearchaeota archaeon]|nr:50S ribosomal protein L21e [Candidatus Woesearchaeota archaeon]
MARIGGVRRSKSSLLSKKNRKKGKVSLKAYLAEFNVGDKVALGYEPAVFEGTYCPRFVGKSGVVLAKRGSCYEVKIMDFKKEKMLIVHPVHLRKV